MTFERYLKTCIENDLEKKMVFVAGPRQVGKTVLSNNTRFGSDGYLNWDADEHRERILKREMPLSDLWIFDEIHKYRSWCDYLKGLYDIKKAEQKILVTGSARLDYYRFGGDSLQGRYFFWRLHPLSIAELSINTQKDLFTLLKLGGFPEPFFSSSETDARRWSREYRNRFIQDEVRELEGIRDLGKLELLMLRLPELSGSPLSINALREDLQLSHRAASSWIDIIERLYGIFRIPPFGAPKIRAVKKEQKHYHYDWTLVKDEPIRFENMVASHLLKWIHFRQDAHGEDLELRYYRDVDNREVDFVLTDGSKPVSFIECKWRDTAVSKSLLYLKHRFPNCEAWQLTALDIKDFQTPEGIRICPALKYLRSLI